MEVKGSQSEFISSDPSLLAQNQIYLIKLEFNFQI